MLQSFAECVASIWLLAFGDPLVYAGRPPPLLAGSLPWQLVQLIDPEVQVGKVAGIVIARLSLIVPPVPLL